MNQQTSHKTGIIIGLLIILALGAGAWYWFAFMRSMPASVSVAPGTNQTGGTAPFKPISTNNQPTQGAGTSGQNQQGTTGSSTPSNPLANINRIRKITENPVAGAVATTTTKVTAGGALGGVVIRYVDKATGHIYEIGANDREPERITNLTIPKVLQTLWHNNGSNVIYRYAREDGAPITDLSLEIQDVFKTPSAIKNVTKPVTTKPGTNNSTLASLRASSTPPTTPVAQDPVTATLIPTKTSVLGTDSYAIALAPKSKRVFILQDNGNGRPVGVITNLNGAQPVTVVDNGSTNWNVQWPEEGSLVLTTKPISLGTGFSYKVNLADKSMTKIGEGAKGLTTLASSVASLAVAGVAENQNIVSHLFSLKDENDSFKDMPFNTLPEKCVWGRKVVTNLYCAVPQRILNENYPEAWYQGEISFSDNLWKINTLNGSVEKIADLSTETKNLIDGTSLSLDINDTVLIFINKRDQTLWQVNLK